MTHPRKKHKRNPSDESSAESKPEPIVRKVHHHAILAFLHEQNVITSDNQKAVFQKAIDAIHSPTEEEHVFYTLKRLKVLNFLNHETALKTIENFKIAKELYDFLTMYIQGTCTSYKKLDEVLTKNKHIKLSNLTKKFTPDDFLNYIKHGNNRMLKSNFSILRRLAPPENCQSVILEDINPEGIQYLTRQHINTVLWNHPWLPNEDHWKDFQGAFAILRKHNILTEFYINFILIYPPYGTILAQRLAKLKEHQLLTEENAQTIARLLPCYKNELEQHCQPKKEKFMRGVLQTKEPLPPQKLAALENQWKAPIFKDTYKEFRQRDALQKNALERLSTIHEEINAKRDDFNDKCKQAFLMPGEKAPPIDTSFRQQSNTYDRNLLRLIFQFFSPSSREKWYDFYRLSEPSDFAAYRNSFIFIPGRENQGKFYYIYINQAGKVESTFHIINQSSEFSLFLATFFRSKESRLSVTLNHLQTLLTAANQKIDVKKMCTLKPATPSNVLSL